METVQLTKAQFDALLKAVKGENNPTSTIPANFSQCTARFDGLETSDVEVFIDNIEVYKECVIITDENALKGLSMLFERNAAIWWRGIKDTVLTWKDAILTLRRVYGCPKPAWKIYRELFSKEQTTKEKTDLFVSKSRALIAQLTEKPSTNIQIDMIYGLLNSNMRSRISRDDCTTFDDLLKKSRNIENSLLIKSELPASASLSTTTDESSDTYKTRLRPRCSHCRLIGHTIEQCRKLNKSEQKLSPVPSSSPSTSTLICYGCGQAGVIKTNCPKCNPKIKTEKIENKDSISFQSLEQFGIRDRLRLSIEIFEVQGSAIVDSGAAISLASSSLFEVLSSKSCEFTKKSMKITLADGSVIDDFVLQTKVIVKIADRDVKTTFTYMPKSQSTTTLLGMDFLVDAKLTINYFDKKWKFDNDKYWRDFELSSQLPNVNISQIQCSLRNEEGVGLSKIQKSDLNQFLNKFCDVFAEKGAATNFTEHIINTGDANPISVPPYYISKSKREILRKELDKMLELDVIEECESPWAAPVVMVPKPNGKVRVCVDYRRLNSVTVSDKYPLPRIDYLLQSTGKSRIISTIDLQSGYWQVKVRESDRDKTAFITCFGTFRFKRMPFGLKNAPATFQRMIDRLKANLCDVRVLAYLDDLIIISDSHDKHLDDLNKIFRKLRDLKLRANREKCVFACSHVKYLGHIISQDGISVDSEKVSAMLDLKPPANVKQVRSVLQTFSWYRKYIPNFSEISRPLSNLMKKASAWKWGPDEQTAFTVLKESLSKAPVLRQIDEDLPFTLRTDASAYALGAVLLQGECPKEEKPVEYASRLLNSAEKNYSTTEREALAVVWALTKFRGYIDGSKVHVVTDHQPLKWLMSLKAPTGRLARWALQIQQFDLDISYAPGKTNVVADLLSRPILDEPMDPIEVSSAAVVLPTKTSNEIREDQLSDEKLRIIIETLEDPDRDLVDYSRYTGRGYMLEQGVLYRFIPEQDSEEPCLVVPTCLQETILKEYHDAPTAGHYGVELTLSRLTNRYYWLGMRQTVANYIRKCLECQKYKASNQKPEGLVQTPVISQRFETLSIDLFGPLPVTPQGYRWIFIIEDTMTKWVELFPLISATAIECAQTLLTEIFTRYGMPRKIISDNGVQFVSAVMQQVLSVLGIKQSLIPVYHPESNPVERKNKDLKVQLAILVNKNHQSWSEHLASVRFAMNTAKTSATGHSAAYLMFARELRTFDDVNRDLRTIIASDTFVPEITPYLKAFIAQLSDTRDHMENQQDIRKYFADKQRRLAITLNPGDRVLVKDRTRSNKVQGVTDKFSPRYDGPYVVKKAISPTAYEIAHLPFGEEVVGKYHIRDLKLFRGEDTAVPLNKIKRRGRPKKC